MRAGQGDSGGEQNGQSTEYSGDVDKKSGNKPKYRQAGEQEVRRTRGCRRTKAAEHVMELCMNLPFPDVCETSSIAMG